ncbi:MAG: response regulator [Deltaproteobacteria bacterium]|nr:response regulator [Deltaproteobacteria bacterium]
MRQPGGVTILVVDDDPAVLPLLEAALDDEAVSFRGAADGAEALALLDQGLEPDLVVLDWVMPGMDGLGFLARFRERPGAERVPVLLLTGRRDADHVAEGLEAGANDYLVKPFDLMELRARVRAALRLRRVFRELDEARAAQLERERLRVVLETAGAVAHALNQPLTAVGLKTETLLDRLGPDSPWRGDLEFVHRGIRRISRAVAKIRRLAVYRTARYLEGLDIVDLGAEEGEGE